MQNASAWRRQDNFWIFLPVPGVIIAFSGGLWRAWEGGSPIRWIRPSKSSDVVKRAVWEYFDRRVEL